MTVKAYSYFRFSSAVQSQGDSLRRQLKAAMDWAAENPDIQLDTSLRDLGVSAYKGEHRVKGALASFLTRVEAGQVARGSYLLVESFDRLSRENETQAINLLTGITLAGIKVVTLADGATYDDKSDAMDLMRAIIVMSRAHEENKSRGRKVAAAWEEKKRRARETGEVVSRRGPGWTRFNATTGKFELIPDRAAIVRRIFGEAADGLGSTAIATRLNAERVSPFGAADGWHAHYVLTILHNASCIGFYQPTNWSRDSGGKTKRSPAGEPIPDYYPRVVSDELYNRVQAVIFNRNKRGKGRGRKGSTFPNLLQGVARCEQCDGMMGVHDTGPKSRNLVLRCHAAARSYGCTNKTRYPLADLEDRLWDFLVQAKQVERRKTPDQSALTAKLDERAELLRKVETLQDALEDGVPFAADRLRQRQAELVALDRAADELRQTITHAGPGAAYGYLDAVVDLWEELQLSTGDERYRARAKANAILIDRFDRIIPIRDGFLAIEGPTCWFYYRDGFTHWQIDPDAPVRPDQAMASVRDLYRGDEGLPHWSPDDDQL